MPIRYVPYVPEPVQGQALLRNVTRTRRLLDYRGADGVQHRIARGMPLYDVDTVEVVGEAGATSGNLLLRGSCLAACAYLKNTGQTVGPRLHRPAVPVGRGFRQTDLPAPQPKAAEALTKAETELKDEGLQAFEETMYGDIWDKEAYLSWMFENLVAIKAVMSETASIYVHIDWHIGPYVKVMLDEVFGEAGFKAEIVWKRTTAHSDAETYGVNHDTIFFYTNGPENVFNTVYQPYTEEYLARFKRFDELPDGTKRYWADYNHLRPKVCAGVGTTIPTRACARSGGCLPKR